MNFFQTLAELAIEHKVKLHADISAEKDIAVVTVIPKTKDKTWPPFVMRGKPEELDQEFYEQLDNLRAGLGIISNAATYADTVKAAVAAPAKPAAPAAKQPEKKTEAKKPEPPKPQPKKPEPKKEEPKKPESQGKPLPPKPIPAPKPEQVEAKEDEESSFSLFND